MDDPPTPQDDPDRTATSDPNHRPDSVPVRIGRYEVRKVLGVGAFGRVYLAHDPELHREVAIKMPLAAILKPEDRERFLREARATARIRHTNVCPILDVGTDGDVPFLVMPFVPTGTLEDLMKRRENENRPFAVSEAVALVEKLARGVAAAHAQKVLHRDLKPANVLWDEANREVLVTDFGQAKITDSALLVSSGKPVGTPVYMSPEQFRGRSAEIGEHSDVYGLGVILYQLVTGSLPLTGDTFWEVMNKVATDEPLPPSAVRKGLDRKFDELCAKALAKKVVERYPTAIAFAEALAAFNSPTVQSLITANPKLGDFRLQPLAGSWMKFTWIPPGAFLMGGNGQATTPPHRVTLSNGFWIGSTPVTQAQWRSVMRNNPSKFKGDDRPVETVSWEDCQKVCSKLGMLTRKPIRLPTEAEWEYACRAGSTTEYCNGDGVEALRKVGWFDGNSEAQTHAVGLLLANAWGLHDVHGSVWEWCQDWLGNLHPVQQSDPTGPPTGKARVHRGGSWDYKAVHCLSAFRSGYDPRDRNACYGFRVCYHHDQ